jgi:hypothetical protein
MVPALLGYQIVFSHKPSLPPTMRLLTYLGGEIAKKGGFKNRLKSYMTPFLTTSMFPKTTDYCRIHYYQ